MNAGLQDQFLNKIEKSVEVAKKMVEAVEIR